MTQRKVLVIDAGHQAFDELTDDDLATAPGGGGAPSDATYLTTAAHAGLSAEVVVTAAGLALLDDAAASDQRTTLGLGTLATQSGTFSGTSSGTNTGDQTVPAFATPAVVLGTAAAAGAASTVIRSDATILAFDATTPAAIGTAAVGAATTATRRDHVHATGAGTPSTQALGDAAATGSGPAAAMTDHKHAMPAVTIADKWTEVVATADQTVTNSAVLVNHTGGGGPALKFTAVSGGVYVVEFFLIYSGNDTAGDFRWNWGLPTVTGWHRWGEGFGASDTLTVNTGVIMSALTTFGADFIGGTDAVDGLRIAYEEFWFRAGANADMQLTFANSTASGGRTSTVRTGSVLRYRRLV